jgi:hypothetical protein
VGGDRGKGLPYLRRTLGMCVGQWSSPAAHPLPSLLDRPGDLLLVGGLPFGSECQDARAGAAFWALLEYTWTSVIPAFQPSLGGLIVILPLPAVTQAGFLYFVTAFLTGDQGQRGVARGGRDTAP